MLYLFLLLNDCLIQPTATTTSVVSASSAHVLPTLTQGEVLRPTFISTWPSGHIQQQANLNLPSVSATKVSSSAGYVSPASSATVNATVSLPVIQFHALFVPFTE